MIFVLAVFVSCSDNSTIPNAMNYEFDELSTMPGYGWFNDEYNGYLVDSSKLQGILENFNPAIHKILFFSRPSCSCPGSHRMFPAVFKILQHAGVPVENMEFYSFSSVGAKHPYDSLMTVSILPSFYVLKSGVPVYSIMDTLVSNSYYEIEYPTLYEDLIFEGLKK